MTKKQFVRMASFLLLAVLMLSMVSNFFRDKETSLSSLYSEPNNSVDVFFVGSSHVNSGFIPGVFLEEYGISAHNVYSWSQPLWISYHYIKEGLKTQTPKVVVVDMHGLLYGHSNEQPEETDRVNYANSFTIDPGLNYLQMVQTVGDCGIDLRNPVDFLNIVRFHSRWKYISSSNFTYNAHKDPSFLKGYGLQVNVEPCPTPEILSTEEVETPYETSVLYLEKIVALSKEKGFELVFTMTPYSYQPHELAFFNWLKEYSWRNNIPFLNYCTDDGKRIGFNWQEQMADSFHINYKGALLVSRDMGEFLQKNYLIRSASTLPNGEQLKKDAEKAYRVIDIHEQHLQGVEAFVSWATTHTNATVIATVKGDLSAMNVSQLQAFKEIGFTQMPDMIAGKDLGYIGVCNNKIVTEYVNPGSYQETFTLGKQRVEISTTGAEKRTATMVLDGEPLDFKEDGVYFLYYDELLEKVVYLLSIDTQGEATFYEFTTK